MIRKQTTSKDGTPITYGQVGSGEGLIIVHGSGRSATDYERLACSLADAYTVYTYNRRGASGQMGGNHNLDRECEDLEALMAETGARNVFGHSMGGFIALETAVRGTVDRVAVYEPPVSINGSVPVAFIASYKAAISERRYGRAMIAALKGLRLHEAAKLPAWLLMLLFGIRKALKPAAKNDAEMERALSSLPVDLGMVHEMNNTYTRYGTLTSPTLLIGGDRSPAYMLQPLQVLSTIIPQNTRKVFKGFHHQAPEENVWEIARLLKHFFK